MDLREWAKRCDYAVTWGPVSLLDQVRDELADHHEAKELAEGFFQRCLTRFRYLADSPLPEVKTVGVVAVPRPAHLLRFSVNGRPVDAVLPPTYLDYDKTSRDVLAAINDSTSSEKLRFAPLHAPLKALATRMGLACYGRNNITYVAGMGSYHQLVGFASDLELDPRHWPDEQAPAIVLPCDTCSACQRACPTGAISGERFLLRGELCLTFFNEYEEAWPGWLTSAAHNCLVGCLLCQKACPHNAGRLRFERTREEFTPDETATLLDGTCDANQPLWHAITGKLARLGLEGYETILGRNLKALLIAEPPPPRPE